MKRIILSVIFGSFFCAKAAHGAPVAYDKSVRIHNSRHPFAISLHSTDADSDQVTFELVSPPAHGDYFVQPSDQLATQTVRTGVMIYTPHVGYIGPDPFAFRVRDSHGNTSNTATVALEVLSPAANPYVPPIGIPKPEFGIEETHRIYTSATYSYNGNPGPYQDAGDGPYTHYIDNTNPSATNTNNPYGTAVQPRASLPSSSDIEPGAVMEIHGGPYTTSQTILRYSGTAEQPVFMRGVSGEKPLFNGSGEIYIDGHHVIIENLSFESKPVIVRPLAVTDEAHHVSVRNCQARMCGIFGVSYLDDTQVHNLVVYQNDIKRDDFDPAAGSFPEDDTMGTYMSHRTHGVWILENDIYQAKGDAFGGGHAVRYTATNYYVGRNLLHQCGENAFDVKEVENVIVSQNKMYDFRGWSEGAGGNGTAAVVHYGPIYSPKNVWFICNEIYDADRGIQAGGDQDYPVYIIGNIIHDIWMSAGDGKAFVTWGCDEVYFSKNVIDNVENGVDWGVQGTTARLFFNNNIVSNVSDDGYALKVEAIEQMQIAEINANLFYQPSGSVCIRWGNADYNVSEFQQATGKGAGSLETDPLFVSAATGDFHLQSDSPAIDHGRTDDIYQVFQDRFGFDIRKDPDGNALPLGSAWDIGVYEYVDRPIPQTATDLSWGCLR